MELPDALRALIAELQPDLVARAKATQAVREKLKKHDDGKKLKGDEITGWLGEIYAKMLLEGTLVSDKYDYDVKTEDMRVSVKARKGAWLTGIIPRVDGDACPTHLMFIRFGETYSIEGVWLFRWEKLRDSGRFLEKTVRGKPRGWRVRINPKVDGDGNWRVVTAREMTDGERRLYTEAMGGR